MQPHPTIPPPVRYLPIADFPGYRVGDDGSVWTCKNNKWGDSDVWRPLKPGKQKKSGHLFVSLWRDGKGHTRHVHRLVLEAFVGPCPPGMESCHDPDPDPANNRLENLRYDTKQANVDDKARQGRQPQGSQIHLSKLTEDTVREIVRLATVERVSQTEIARRFNLTIGAINSILTGRNWRHVTGFAKPARFHPPGWKRRDRS